jgi:hypothetical protein
MDSSLIGSSAMFGGKSSKDDYDGNTIWAQIRIQLDLRYESLPS